MKLLNLFWSVIKKYTITVLLTLGILVCFLGLFIVEYEYAGWIVLVIYILTVLYLTYHEYSHHNKVSESIYRVAKIKNTLSHYGPFIKVFPLFLPLVLAVTGNRISASTKLFFKFDFKQELLIDWYVFLFWILLFSWVILISLYLTKNDNVNRTRLNELLNSIHNSPDKKLFISYPKFYTQMLLGLDKLSTKQYQDNNEKTIDEIKVILKTITELTKYFSPHADSKEEIGANVWLLFTKKDQAQLIDTLPAQIDFDCTYQEDNVTGVLVLISDLILSGDQQSENFNLSKKYIILPLPKESKQNNRRQALPGAPWAVRKGFSVYNDISKLKDDLGDFKAGTRDAIIEYFTTKEGKHINSFASVRIGTDKNPIGVINVDSNHDMILGDKHFYQTYFALIEPILTILRSKVLSYRDHFVGAEDFPWVK